MVVAPERVVVPAVAVLAKVDAPVAGRAAKVDVLDVNARFNKSNGGAGIRQDLPVASLCPNKVKKKGGLSTTFFHALSIIPHRNGP